MAEDSSNNGIVKVGNNAIMRYSNALVRRAINDLSPESQIYNNAILMVDDDINTLDLMIHVLEEGGFKNIDRAEDGKDAIEKLLSRKYKLVSLNLNMPYYNGFEVLELMNQHKILTKAIIISGINDEKIVSATMDIGALVYLVKPVTSHQLLSTVISILKQNE